MAESVTSLQGPVERVGGRLALQIPLAEGGAAFVACARGIGRVQGNDLVVAIPDWLAKKLQIGDGSIVSINNAGGKFNIRRVQAD